MQARSKSGHSGKESGFAIIIALSMMSFVLLLLLSMTVLVQVETRSSATALAQLRAKESARLAMYMALGDLQRHAGPDQRVTARAEILGAGLTTENPFWTGVWDTTSAAGSPRWMVSWQDQTKAPNTNTMQVVGPGRVGTNPANYVDAPVIEVVGPAGSSNSEIAWWVSDEGVKASAGLEDAADRLPDQFFTDFSPSGLGASEQRQILKQISPRRFRTEVFLGQDTKLAPGEIEDITFTLGDINAANAQLKRANSWNQLGLLGGVGQTELESAFHSMTYLSKSVIANSKTGGLKKDLSDQSFDDTTGAIAVGPSLREFLWNSSPDSNGNINIKGLSQTDYNALSTGDIVNTTTPLITEFALYFAVSGQRKTSSTARAFLRFEAEVWSPYGFRHNFTGSSGSNTPELFVELENLPTVQLTFFDKDQVDANLLDPTIPIISSSAALDLNVLNPKFELDLTDSHKAGEIRRTTGAWSLNASSDPKSFFYGNNWSWNVTDLSYNSSHRSVSFPNGDWINYASGTSKVNLILKNGAGDILQRIENIPIGGINTDFGFYEDTPSGLSSSDAPIVFYYRLYSDRADLEKLLTTADPRAILFDLDQPDTLNLVDINDANGDKLGDADTPSLSSFSNLDLLHGQPNNNFFRLYDLPATIPYSLGVLQHLHLHEERPFSIGNNWGGSRNGVFDQYFISGIPQDPTVTFWTPGSGTSPNPLPNPSIRVYPRDNSLTLLELATFESAKHLLSAGGFNINSTSRNAWLALLASNYIYDWRYDTNRGTSSETTATRLNLEASHFRLPFSGHYRSEAFSKWRFPFEDFESESTIGDDYPALIDSEREAIFRKNNGVSSLDWRPSLALGHRENTSQALQQLANEIVNRLETRGTPFASLEDFISSGILQSSIDQTPINTIVNGTNYTAATDDQRMPRNASAFLSQADIVSSIAPYIASRSDTFTIHAVGSSIDPITGADIGQVACIALVQRVPERLDGNAAAVMNNATGFGRRFVIKDIKWLNASQL